jgi:hypothetical protein
LRVDHIITNKIIPKKPVDAIPLFKDSEQAEEKKTDDKETG